MRKATVDLTGLPCRSSAVVDMQFLEPLLFRFHDAMPLASGFNSFALQHLSFVIINVIGRGTENGVEAAVDSALDHTADE
jgi:hypothetical protein